jgi:hypothetical protein
VSVQIERGGAAVAVMSNGRGRGRSICFSLHGVDSADRIDVSEIKDLISALAQAVAVIESDALAVCDGCAVRRVALGCIGVTRDGERCFSLPSADEYSRNASRNTREVNQCQHLRL